MSESGAVTATNTQTHCPLATYRLQLNKSFPLSRVAESINYLSELGVSHIYASPVLKASAGSEHGYDVTDPRVINPEIGTEQEFVHLLESIRDKKMGWVQDFVPNHMALSSENPLLMDICENGE